MSRPKFLIYLSIFCCLLVVNSAHSAQKPRAGKKTVQQATPPPQEQAPPPPPTPEQMPAVAPQVSYSNGQLTIVARNSTLSDILRAVKAKTGADVDFPGSANERVVGQFGPGESQDVVASLLNGSHFNYVMMASESNPNQLKTLIVTSKAGSTPETQPGAVNQPPQAEPPPQIQAQEQPIDQGEEFTDDSTETDQIADQPIQDEQQQPAPQVNISPNGQVQPNVKTPEQLLQELQQRQQQLQQQQQNGAPTPGAPQGFPIPPQGAGPN
ncbi:MAG TPA: hypothetical protein VFA68_21740 [Terriglobales bacterium]|nr:hypothetical protein [Terriglobales bacterium]